jgi:transcriptional regulator with XRE-family HTH domain
MQRKRDYSLLSRQIVKCLRGKHSQEKLNRKLASLSNQIARWESGHAKISWSSFCELCKSCRVPLQEVAFKTLFYDQPVSKEKNLIHYLRLGYSQADLSQKLEISKSQVSKILAGKNRVSLELILRFIDVSPYDLADFVSKLTAPQIPPLIAEENARLEKEKSLHFEKPWIAPLLLFLNCKDYKSLPTHSDLFLSEKLRVREEDIKTAVQELYDLELISRQEGQYVPLTTHLNTSGSFDGNRNIRRFWWARSLSHLEKVEPGQNNFYGYKVFNVANEEMKRKFEELYFKFYSDLDALIKNQNKSELESVYLLTMNLVDISDM